jgi:hypothetical protein
MKRVSIYSAGGKACLFPLSGKIMFVHEEGTPLITIDLDDAMSVGQSLNDALGHSVFRPNVKDSVNYAEVSRRFQQNIELFRSETGLSKKKFEDSLQLIEVESNDKGILFWPHAQARGKLAFEGACKAEDRPHVDATADVSTLGETIMKLISEL